LTVFHLIVEGLMHQLSIPCLVMASINFYVGLYSMFLFLKRSKMKEYLPFALLCFSVGFYDIFAAGLYSSNDLISGISWQRLELMTIFPTSIFLIWFIPYFTKTKISRFTKLLLSWFTALFILTAFINFFNPELLLSESRPAVKDINLSNILKVTYFEGDVGVFSIGLVSTIIAYIYFLYRLFRMYFQQKDKTLFILIVSIIVFFIGTINDEMVALRIYNFIYIGEYCFLGIIVSMAYFLMNQFADAQTAFEHLNLNLEKIVDERTQDIIKLNEELKHLADFDFLTEVYNRRFFNEYFEIEIKRARNHYEHRKHLNSLNENDMNFGLAIFDIDDFKKINNIHGHLAGDEVLRELIKIVKKNIFTRDVLCRYGGDEFALLLTKTSNEGIVQAIEKIRKEIHEHSFSFSDSFRGQHVTISIGVVNFNEALHKKSEEIIKLADDRLLMAKRAGKNRIVCG
jgi:diguanylate cyclase (GGDEF)-like protein